MNNYYEFLGVAVLSLIITFILFKFLESYATGKGNILGSTISYGGSLAGFVLIFYILNSAYMKIMDDNEKTSVNIAGEWSIELKTADGIKHTGTAYIKQDKGNIHIKVNGIIDTTKTSFSSFSGVIIENRILFIYENSEREYGIARAISIHDNPDYIVWKFNDVDEYDDDNTPEGTIEFKKNVSDGWFKSLFS